MTLIHDIVPRVCAHWANVKDCEGQVVVLFNYRVAPGRNAAIRAGWNDGAWGRPQRAVNTIQAPWYQRGYEGGLIFRHKQQSDLAERSALSSALPRIVRAA